MLPLDTTLRQNNRETKHLAIQRVDLIMVVFLLGVQVTICYCWPTSTMNILSTAKTKICIESEFNFAYWTDACHDETLNL